MITCFTYAVAETPMFDESLPSLNIPEPTLYSPEVPLPSLPSPPFLQGAQMANPKAITPFLCIIASFFFCASSPEAAGAVAAAAAAAAATRPDYFKLTLTWPGATCSARFSRCCLPTTGEPELDFFIQDMAAYTLSGKVLTNCKAETPCAFKINALANVITDLYGYWSDIGCPSNNGMDNWKTIWCTYGSCSNLTQTDYFGRALALRARLDLLTLLQDYDIVPSEKKMYKLTDVEDVIVSEFGFSTVVECSKKLVFNPLPTWEFQISKVHVCVSADAKLIIGCPTLEKSNCGAEVRFYPFTSGMLQGGAAGEGIIRMMPSA